MSPPSILIREGSREDLRRESRYLRIKHVTRAHRLVSKHPQISKPINARINNRWDNLQLNMTYLRRCSTKRHVFEYSTIHRNHKQFYMSVRFLCLQNCVICRILFCGHVFVFFVSDF